MFGATKPRACIKDHRGLSANLPHHKLRYRQFRWFFERAKCILAPPNPKPNNNLQRTGGVVHRCRASLLRSAWPNISLHHRTGKHRQRFKTNTGSERDASVYRISLLRASPNTPLHHQTRQPRQCFEPDADLGRDAWLYHFSPLSASPNISLHHRHRKPPMLQT